MNETKELDFQNLLVKNRGRLIRICRIYAQEKEDQEDLFQEIAYQIWRSMKNFRGEAKIDTFLYRIALNTALLFQSRQRKKPGTVKIEEVQAPSYHLHIQEQLDQQDKISWLYGAIKELKPIEQTLILLYLEEMSYEEISQVSGLKVNHVGVKINRIKKKLSKKVKANN